METLRILTKKIDLATLHREMLAAFPANFQGLCAGSADVGDALRIISTLGVNDAAVDAVLLAHIPPTTDEVKQVTATAFADDIKLKAVIRATLDEIDGRHPANQVDRQAFRTRVIGYIKAAL